MSHQKVILSAIKEIEEYTCCNDTKIILAIGLKRMKPAEIEFTMRMLKGDRQMSFKFYYGLLEKSLSAETMKVINLLVKTLKICRGALNILNRHDEYVIPCISVQSDFWVRCVFSVYYIWILREKRQVNAIRTVLCDYPGGNLFSYVTPMAIQIGPKSGRASYIKIIFEVIVGLLKLEGRPFVDRIRSSPSNDTGGGHHVCNNPKQCQERCPLLSGYHTCSDPERCPLLRYDSLCRYDFCDCHLNSGGQHGHDENCFLVVAEDLPVSYFQSLKPPNKS